MVEKFFKILKFLLKVKINFHKPKRSDIIVFDSTSIDQIKNVLKNYNWGVIDNRNELITNLYITPKIIIKFFFNLNKNIKIAYLVSVIETIKPKVVLTFIDNSYYFAEITRSMRNKKIVFIAIQNAARIDIAEHDYFYKKGILKFNPNKNFYLPNFFCHGKNDLEIYKKCKIKIDKFYKTGSLRLFNALSKSKKIKKKYEICLLSNTTWTRDLVYNDKTFIPGYVKLVEFIIKFAKEKKIRFIFSLKNKNNFKEESLELSIFKRYLTKQDYKFLKKNSTFQKKQILSSYDYAFNSKLVIGQTSTMLGECLAYKKKILSCNFSKLSYLDFPVKGICRLDKANYKTFKKRVNLLLNCTNSFFQRKINKKINFIVNYDSKINPNLVIRNFIDKALKKTT